MKMRCGWHKNNVRHGRVSWPRHAPHWISSTLLIALLYNCAGSVESTQHNTSRSASAGADDNQTAEIGHHFDDEANFNQEYVLKSVIKRTRAPVEAPAPNVSFSSGFMLRSHTIPGQGHGHAHSSDEHEHLNGDLLAIESSDKSLLTGSNAHLPSPPYAVSELTGKKNFSALVESDDRPQTGDTRLLKLHRTHETAPIYLRYPLPIGLSRSQQVAAFQHPAAARRQPLSQSGSGYLTSHQQTGASSTFALLPSWPSVYIAQREQQINTTAANSSRSLESSDPKVPTIYPSWSSRNSTDQEKAGASLEVRRQQQQNELGREQISSDITNGQQLLKSHSHPRTANRTGANLTASEVEYEETPERRPLNVAKTKSRFNETNDWAKLLRQAAKSTALESVMLTNNSVIGLFCDTDAMLVRLKFRRPFHGVVETNLDPNERCRLFGNGSQFYEMRVDLYGCGTRQEMPRLFINNLQIQFNNPLALLDQTRRTSFASQQQQFVGSDEGAEELKTIICNYPVRAPGLTVSRQPERPKSTDLNRWGILMEGRHGNTSLPTNISDRIIEVPSGDGLAPARLGQYEPIILISALLLLAVASALALVASAFLVRRRHRSLASRSSTQHGPSGDASASVTRIYNRSPAQMANQRQLATPPLIGLSKEDSLLVRPSLKRYATRTKGRVTRGEQQISGKHSNRLGDRQYPARPACSSMGETSDSLESSARGDRSSITTIEIPFVGHSGERVSHFPAGNPPAAKRRFERDEAVQTEVSGPDYYREYMKFKRREEITETSSRIEPVREKSVKTNSAPQAAERPRRQSPIPFGSFRSKLTSPSEFKRLQNVLKLFNDQGQDPAPDPDSNYARLRMKIQRTLSESERSRLLDLLSNDEVFRSNILESVDQESFGRKLRDNPNYSNKFSSVTWKLVEEILLRVDVERLISSGTRGPATKQVDKESRPQPPQLKHSPPPIKPALPVRPSLPPKPASKPGGLSQNANQRAQVASSGDQSDGHASLSEDSIGAVRVSQSNSTSTRRMSDGTMINVDSVTNISTPKNLSAYTRSSFSQVTKYEENHRDHDSSLPYMDD